MLGSLLILHLFSTMPVLGFPTLSQTKPPQSSAKSAKPPTDFETDRRLNTPMSLAMLKIDHAAVWTRIDRRTGVLIEREDAAREFDDAPVALAGNTVSTRAWMDALAARILARWERTEKNGYRFLVSQNELDFVYSAKDEWEAERNQAGAEFFREMKNLPAEDQAAIMGGKPYPMAELPDSMRGHLQTMLDSFGRKYEAQGRNSPFPERLPVERYLEIECKPAKGFDRYWFSFTDGKTPNGGFRINNYDEKKRERLAAQDKDTIYTPKHYEVKPEDAGKNPKLKRTVTVNLQNVTFPQVLKHLNSKYGTAFVSDPEVSMPQKANVNLEPMPLWKLLDALTEIYSETEWEWRKYGFIVVRGPDNQIRKGVLIGGLEKKRHEQQTTNPKP